MNILIYGAGAVGLGLASFLLKAGATVHLLARESTAKHLNQHGLIRRGIFGNLAAPAHTFGVATTLDQTPATPYDFVLVTTKSFDSLSSAQDLARHPAWWNERTKIVLCQNGWGNAEIFAEYFPQRQIFNARIITGFTRPQPHEVMVTVHADDITLGSLFGHNPDEVQPLCAALHTGGIPCRLSTDISKDLWAKMLYNCALNPLGAIFRVTYGKLGELKESRTLMNHILTEIFSVMTHAGYQTHWDTAEDYQKIFYSRLIPATADHLSSTLQDMTAKKKTEINALNGMIVHLAQKHNLAVPVNTTVFQMVKFLEKINTSG